MYILRDGTEVTSTQIKAAFVAGLAVLVHGRGANKTTTSLMIDGKHYDTRGECYSMWDEAWTCEPETLQEALWSAR